MDDDQSAARIRILNDALRCQGQGGEIFQTRGVAALDEGERSAILSAVAAFDNFSLDNDPHGEHDCAVLSIGGCRIIWKIDYYDVNYRMASPDPTDPSVTRRVLTIMLAEEY